MSLAALLALGFLLGMRHATDADHVVAVSAIVSRERTLRAAAPVGIAWGIGHGATILLVGGAIILFGLVITPRVGLGMELAVGLMLIVVGALSIQNLAPPGHGHPTPLHGRFRASGGYRLLRPLVVGVVHGVAGSTALALVVLGTVRKPAVAMAYLGLVGAGTIAGMFVVTLAFSAPLVFSSRRFGGVQRSVTVAAALVSVALGVYLVYEVVQVHGFFTQDPRWTPR